MRWERESFWVSDATEDADIDFMTEALHTTYWARRRPREVVAASVANSIVLTLYDGERPIGFTRMVSDRATFAWLCDVFVLPEYRGQGLGSWLVGLTVHHPAAVDGLQLLATRDAHGLYEKHGFERRECMMRRRTHRA